MSERPPRVTVGIPVYNGENYLREAIESAIHQTFRDIEILISDNGSTDRTQAICEEYAARDPRVRYHRQERNLGASPNHNWLTEHARGELFIFLMHDDWHGPMLLELTVAALDAMPSAVLACCKVMEIDAAGKILGPHPESMPLMQDTPHARFHRCIRGMRKECLVHSRLGVIRLAELRKVAPVGSYHSSDKPHQAELALLGKFIELQEHIFFRRRHAASSLEANKDVEALNRWFDTSYRGGKRNYKLCMYLSFMKAPLRHSEIGLREQFLCLLAVQPWAWQMIRDWCGLRKRDLFRLLGLTPTKSSS